LITILQIIEVLLDIAWWIIVVQAIMSWLIAFNVINTYNDTVRAIWQALEKITEPVYRPIRRILPDFGALDLSPLVVLLVIGILSRVVIPNIAAWYLGQGTL
jgi:YggT family protein